MKTSALIIAACMTLASNIYASSKKVETMDLGKNYQTLTILDKGVKRTIYLITEDDSNKTTDKSIMKMATSVSKDIKEGIVLKIHQLFR